MKRELQYILNSVVNHKEKNRYLCEMFQELPAKEEYPDYYQLIKNPIAIENIEQKLETDQYKDIDSMRNDVEQMVKNAMIYNRKGSAIYRDASLIITIFDEYLDKLDFVKKVNSQCKKFLATIKTKISPKTLEIIKTVNADDNMILDDINRKIEEYEYKNYADFEGDFEIILTELQENHEDDEEIVKDCDLINSFLAELNNDDDNGGAAKDITGTPLKELVYNGETYQVGMLP